MLARTLIPLLIWLPGLPGDLGPEETRQIEVFRRAAPSVVNVHSLALRRNLFSLDVSRSRAAAARALSGTAKVTWSPTSTCSKVGAVFR